MSDEETYKGKKIEVREEQGAKRLYLDGKPVEVILDGATGTYSSLRLPYSNYSSLKELGRALVDN